MMYSNGFAILYPLVFAIHMIGMMLCAIGIVFLIAWAIKNLKAEKLKYWSWWLIGIGIVLCILTIPFIGFHANIGNGFGARYNMMYQNGWNDDNLPPMMRGYGNPSGGSQSSI